MKRLFFLVLLLAGCATTATETVTEPPSACNQSRPLGSCEYDRVYEGANIYLVPAGESQPYCAQMVIGIRMASSMEGPWISKTYWTAPGGRLLLPPGIGETKPEDCRAYAPR